MANPVLTVDRSPTGVVAPGTQLTLTVTATDADARSVTYTFTGTDQGGNEIVVTESVVVSDPVTVTAAVDDPAGVADLVPDPVNPMVWRSTV